VGELQAVSGEQ